MFTKTPFTPGTEGVWLNLPADVYHKAPGVSQSILKEFDGHATPLHFHVAKPKVATDDMKFGTICHTAVLEPGNLPKAYYIQPEKYPATVKGKKGEPDTTVEKDWHGGADWCKEWVRTHADRPVIDKEREACIPKIVSRVKQLDPFGAALENGQREVSFFKRDEVTGLLLKCRVDVMATAHDGITWLFDLKKVLSGEASPEAFSKQAANLGYHIQAASYLRITGASRFVFVPFDDEAPFDACQLEPDADMLDYGAKEYRRILDAFAECLKCGIWPGYKHGINRLTLPPWAKKKATQAEHDAWLLKVMGGAA